MAEEKIRCKVTDTKQTIIKAYKSHLDEINKQKQGSLNPEAVQSEKKKIETLKRVESVAQLDVPSTIQSLQSNISSTFNNILSDLDEKRNALNDVEEAINIKKQELHELYEIENEAGSLAALIEAHKKTMSELEDEYDQKEKELQDALDSAEKDFEKKQNEWKEQLTEMKRQDSQLRSREMEEYKYGFERNKKIELDALQDQIDAQKKKAAEREAVLSQREAAIEDLENQIKTLETRLQTETAEAADKAKKDAQRSAAIEKNFLEKDHKAEINSLQAKLEAVTDRVHDLVAQNEKLQNHLDAANQKVQTIAAAALESQGNARTIEHLRGMAESTGSGKR